MACAGTDSFCLKNSEINSHIYILTWSVRAYFPCWMNYSTSFPVLPFHNALPVSLLQVVFSKMIPELFQISYCFPEPHHYPIKIAFETEQNISTVKFLLPTFTVPTRSIFRDSSGLTPVSTLRITPSSSYEVLGLKLYWAVSKANMLTPVLSLQLWYFYYG